jgi:hypothetical protein
VSHEQSQQTIAHYSRRTKFNDEGDNKSITYIYLTIIKGYTNTSVRSHNEIKEIASHNVKDAILCVSINSLRRQTLSTSCKQHTTIAWDVDGPERENDRFVAIAN